MEKGTNISLLGHKESIIHFHTVRYLHRPELEQRFNRHLNLNYSTCGLMTTGHQRSHAKSFKTILIMHTNSPG